MSEFIPYKPKRGEIIAYVNGSNDELVYTRMDEEGRHWGFVYSPEHDIAHEEKCIEVLANYLDFKVLPGKELFPPFEDDKEDEQI
jgi:hypothetical protein